MTTAWALLGLDRDAWLALPMGTRIELALWLYRGWSYPEEQTTPVAVAYESPAVRLEVATSASRRRINCSTLTASILTAVFPTAPWDSQAYGQLQVYREQLPANADSPIDAVERVDVGRRFEVDVASATGPRWFDGYHLVQGWRSVPPYDAKASGHAFLVLAVGGRPRLKIDSTITGHQGPRAVGTSWAELRQGYPRALYVARLADLAPGRV